METRISATALAKNLSDILNRIRYRGERFVVERNGEAIATLAPVEPASNVRLRDVLDRLGDLSLPGDGFADDLEALQAGQPRSERPPWPT